MAASPRLSHAAPAPSTTADWLHTAALLPVESAVIPDADRTAAHDTVLRLALGLWAADPASTLTPAQRQWLADRLQAVDAAGHHVVFTASERVRLREGLLAYVAGHRASILPVVRRQFDAPVESGQEGLL